MYIHVVRKRRYLYLWHYETAGGRRRQVKEYLGPAEDDGVRQEAVRRIDTYVRLASRDLQRLRKETLAAIARMR